MQQSGVLVLNAGSSSIKFLFFAERQGDLSPVIRGQVEGLHTAPRFVARDAEGGVLAEKSWGEGTSLGHDGAMAHLAAFLQQQGAGYTLRAVGHRVVHGGLDHVSPVRLDRDVLAALEKLVPLAPLHQPHNLAPIRVLLERQPQLPQVACFDTAFHASNPDVARRFAIPAELHDAGVRRYGFHGLSYEYVASALPAHDARAAAGKVIVCHLGNGSSMCALDAGRSVATQTVPNLWESSSDRSTVSAIVRSTQPAGSETLPWALMAAVPTSESGMFAGVTSIQRVNTASRKDA